jgi:hypothetical protein
MLRLRPRSMAVLAFLLVFILPGFPANASAPAGPSAPGACSELLRNGNFESQSAYWAEEGSPGTELITLDHPRTGSYSAYLGGVLSSDHRIRQQITLPAGQMVTLHFWSLQETLEQAPSLDDYLAVRLLDQNGLQLAEVAQYGVDPDLPLAFEPFTVYLAPYAGKTVQLQFLVHNGQSDKTWYFVDDVSVTSCVATHVYLPLIRK